MVDVNWTIRSSCRFSWIIHKIILLNNIVASCVITIRYSPIKVFRLRDNSLISGIA